MLFKFRVLHCTREDWIIVGEDDVLSLDDDAVFLCPVAKLVIAKDARAGVVFIRKKTDGSPAGH